MGEPVRVRRQVNQAERDDYDRRQAVIERNGNKKLVRPLPRISKDIIPPKRGTNIKKYTPLRMVNGINRYFAWCEEKDRIPSIKGMMESLKLYPKTFYKYIEHDDFREIMEWARMIIKGWLEEDVYLTPGQATGKIAYMKNTHDWSEKISTENKTEVTQKMSVDQARSKLQALAPLLLEQLKDQRLVHQLGQVTDAELVEESDGKP